MEVVMEAVDLLKERADVQPNAIAVAGLSRGAELALITGALDPDVHAVVSIMGTYEVHGALQPDGVAWLYQGKPLPFQWIPVEQIKGPVLLLHGEQDARWPVGHSYLVADRLAAHGRPYEIIVYPGLAHNLGSEDIFFGPSLTFCLARCWARAAR
ncbi:MAG TPA: acyl-CoA thioester hydrolase/BAAT C-terminal domain-containing protein [Ardenticatenaceae bacterium]|nr:acyl-CoA thioester hydrolase/BAAT C-terminal domain-containing protein [Ardenticatenaceae bacterium]